MASMTDFIESINVADEPSVYNEDYSWAEEYSEYFNDVSDNYIQPIFESSGYQFFGEATFYQEAHKGLIAGGILALVSGAFFMIMKLLRNGGSGGSSASSNDSAKKDVAKRRAKATEEIYKKAEKDVEAKRKEYETAKEEIKSKPPKTETIDDKKPEPSKPREYSKLDDEENLTYNFTMIFNKLAQYKKDGYEKVMINGGITDLDYIFDGLSLIHDISRIMVELVEKENWYVFGSTDTKDPLVNIFTKKYSELDELVKKLKAKSSNYQKKDNNEDVDINWVKGVLKDIDDASKAIEKTCKKGIELCKKKREVLKRENKDVSNIDKSYKILNGIIRDVNIICKNLQHAFSDIQKAMDSKGVPFPLNPSYYILPNIGSINDPFDEMAMIINKDPAPKMLMPLRLYGTCIKAIRAACEHALKESPNGTITESTIKKIEKDGYGHIKNAKAALARSNKNFVNSFNLMKKKQPSRVEEFEYVEPIIAKGYECLIDLMNVPIREMVGQRQSDTNIPAIINLIKFRNEYLSDSKGVEISDKIHDINYKNFTPFGNKKSNNNTSSVDAYVENMPVTSFNAFFDNLKREEDDIRKTLYIPAAPHSIQFHKQLQKEFAKYEDDKDQEDFAINVHSILEKYVYGSDTYMSNSEWQRIERMLDRIGYKSIEAKVGDNISLSKTYWTRPIKAKNPGDKESNTIKQIQQMPRVMKINIDGDDVVMKLAGKCTYWE